MEEVIKNIPLSHKIPALMHLINMYAEEEEFEVCAIIRKELDKYTIEPPFSRGGMEIFLREHAKNKYLELGYHIDISELKAYRLKKRIDNIRNKGGKIDLIKEILDEYYN